VLKKRASANNTERAAWQADDLLFISNYGEGDDRQISFAHFSTHKEKADLPTLMVLGWDSGNTALHLADVASKLTTNLSWPEHRESAEHWRERWRSAFTLRHQEVITTSKALAERLADLARSIRKRVNAVLKIESDKGLMRKLHIAFKETLIHDLEEDDFADMYAQTIAYGLLTARVSRPSGLVAENLRDMVPVTNPFLRDLLESFLDVGGRKGKIDFDELGISEIVQLLRDADMAAVLRDFGDRNPEDDPAIHFYESFLKEYDPDKRMKRGVFYTPRPVVSYIVRRVHELLRTEFGIEDGLASTITWGELAARHSQINIPDGVVSDDPFVQILDPATGTATFLVEAIDVIHRTLVDKWNRQRLTEAEQLGAWNHYVPTHLLRRLHGYELMMAPYAIAHMKIGLKLYETGYKFGSNERARVYLTNALEPPSDNKKQREFDEWAPALAHEAHAVNAIKRNQRFAVVFGNPPYSDASQNLGPEFAYLIERFRYYAGSRIQEKGAIRFEHVINNDYVKFWGLVLHILNLAPVGIACLITSNSFLEGKSFRGVRDGMLDATTQIVITNLHGEGWAGQLAKAGVADENVFEIQTGVTISELLKWRRSGDSSPAVIYGEVAGTYLEKVAVLQADPPTIDRIPVVLSARQYSSFVPSSSNGKDEYWAFPQVDSFFINSVDGIKTSRDGLVIGNSRIECREKILRFADSALSTDKICIEFRLENESWDIRKAQRHLRATFSENQIKRIAYRPFDIRYIYYDRELIVSHRMNLMPSMLVDGSSALVFASRLSSKGFDHVVATDTLCAHKYASHDLNSRMFPIVGRFAENMAIGDLSGNIRTEMFEPIGFDPHASDVDRARACGGYLYAVTNAKSYRARYFEEISQDFPRVPLSREESLGRALAALGLQLQQIHCLNVVVPDREYVFRGIEGERTVSPKLQIDGLWIGKESRFCGVESEIFEFRMAGYQVCKTWFSAGGRVMLQRTGLPITTDLIREFRTVMWAIRETIRVRALIDEVIEKHGGWPDAFAT
jgi:predicted helicase